MAMPMSMDRSKYRNPDIPIGYVRKNPRLEYKIGIEIDGIHYIWAPYLHEADVENREDYATLSDLITSGEEDVIIDNEKNLEQKPGRSQSSLDASALDASLSHMNIDSERRRKKNKSKKPKKTNKIRHKSDSDNERNFSPSTNTKSKKRGRKNHHRSSSSDSESFNRSPSTSHRHYNPPSSYKHHSPPRDIHKNIVAYSPSPEPEPGEWMDAKVKQEPREPEHLFGSYICEVCNITMNSHLTYNTHMNGKRHRKNLKLKNVSLAVAESMPATVVSKDQTKYPKPPAGVVRKKILKTAEIQHTVERSINRPCPGLNHVTEIQGLSGTQYYCSICDCVCSSSSLISHLSGYKHQLNTLKVFKPGVYEQMQFKPKFKAEKEIISILHAVQKKDGMGRMAVEVEELVSNYKEDDNNLNQPSTSRDTTSQPSTSRGTDHRLSGMSFHEKYNRASVPSATSSDFYCRDCDSHMNSLGMWEAHIRGKRHIKNINKLPGDKPSKTRTVLVNKKAFIMKRLKKECPDEPIVGLQEIREIENRDTNSHSYQCFLCGSCHTNLDIIEHLISLKHRTKYLEHINFHGREVIYGMGDSAAYTLVRDMCAQEEAKNGSGVPEVHAMKSSLTL